MGQRSMLCTNQMIDIKMDQQAQGYIHPEPCILLGGVANFPQSDIQTMISASHSRANLDAPHLQECYDSAIFYEMPQYHGVQHHPHHHAPNLDLGVVATSNFYVPYVNPFPGMPLSHVTGDHLPSYSNCAVVGVSADGTNSLFMDNARSSYKRKNAEGNLGNFQHIGASASFSSSVAPLNTRYPDGVTLVDAAPFTMPHYQGNSTSSVREGGPHRSVRNRLGATGLDPVVTHTQNHLMPGNYMGLPFQPAGSLWLDQQLSNGSRDTGAPAWMQGPTIPYMRGNNVNRGLLETGNLGPQRYHDPTSNRGNGFLHTPPMNPRDHNFHHLSLPIQGIRGHIMNVLPLVPTASFRVPTSYSSQSTMNPSQDGPDTGLRHPGSIQPTGLRIYQPHRDGVVPETTLRHRNLPQLRVLPTDGVAVLEFPYNYDVENYVDHHSDMRLDIEDMSYEELLSLGEWIGNVNTGASEETIRTELKMRTYLSSPTSINLEAAARMDQESDSCIICQDDYKSQQKIGTLDCGHEYHADCLKKWLRVKNVCPICKFEALKAEKKEG